MITDSNLQLIAHHCAKKILERYNITSVINSTYDDTYMNFATTDVISYAVKQLSIKVSSMDSDALNKIKNTNKFKQYLIEQITILVEGIRMF